VVERQLGVHPLEPGVLRFQVLDTPQLGGLQAAVLRLPLVVGRNADAGLPADVLDRHAGVGLLEDRDDLGLGETGLLHGTSWLGKTCQKVLLMGCLRIGEAYGSATPAPAPGASVGAGAPGRPGGWRGRSTSTGRSAAPCRSARPRRHRGCDR